MKYFLLIAAFFCFRSCINNKNEGIQSETEKSNNVRKMKLTNELFVVARIDSTNQRVFVVIDSTSVTDINKVKLIVNQIDGHYKFKDDLNVSFVTAKKYADYKTNLNENKNIPYSEFYLNYLGEYNKSTKIYWTFPALPNRKTKYNL
jgi:hypothetical protein